MAKSASLSWSVYMGGTIVRDNTWRPHRLIPRKPADFIDEKTVPVLTPITAYFYFQAPTLVFMMGHRGKRQAVVCHWIFRQQWLVPQHQAHGLLEAGPCTLWWWKRWCYQSLRVAQKGDPYRTSASPQLLYDSLHQPLRHILTPKPTCNDVISSIMEDCHRRVLKFLQKELAVCTHQEIWFSISKSFYFVYADVK